MENFFGLLKQEIYYGVVYAECYGEGETLDEAIEEANEAAYNWISLELDEDDCQLPPVSDEDDLELEDGDIVRNISVNIRFYEGWDE